MIWRYSPYLLPLLATSILCAAFVVVIWPLRRAPGARALGADRRPRRAGAPAGGRDRPARTRALAARRSRCHGMAGRCDRKPPPLRVGHRAGGSPHLCSGVRPVGGGATTRRCRGRRGPAAVSLVRRTARAPGAGRPDGACACRRRTARAAPGSARRPRRDARRAGVPRVPRRAGFEGARCHGRRARLAEPRAGGAAGPDDAGALDPAERTARAPGVLRGGAAGAFRDDPGPVRRGTRAVRCGRPGAGQRFCRRPAMSRTMASSSSGPMSWVGVLTRSRTRTVAARTSRTSSSSASSASRARAGRALR